MSDAVMLTLSVRQQAGSNQDSRANRMASGPNAVARATGKGPRRALADANGDPEPTYSRAAASGAPQRPACLYLL
jgi:hypothetical protein